VIKIPKETQEALLRLKIGLVILTLIFIFGSLGFYFLEEKAETPLDAFYFTLVTISTVGYGDITPTTQAGKMLAITIIFLGVGSVFITIPTFFELLVKRELKEVLKLPGEKSELKDHIVVCGWGKVGKSLVDDFRERNMEFVVVENDEDRVKHLVDKDINVIQGDCKSESVLKNAGVDCAKILVTTLDDSDNVFTILTAKILNPDIDVISKVDYPQNTAKLRQVGANQIINCYEIGASSIVKQVTEKLSTIKG